MKINRSENVAGFLAGLRYGSIWCVAFWTLLLVSHNYYLATFLSIPTVTVVVSAVRRFNPKF